MGQGKPVTTTPSQEAVLSDEQDAPAIVGDLMLNKDPGDSTQAMTNDSPAVQTDTTKPTGTGNVPPGVAVLCRRCQPTDAAGTEDNSPIRKLENLADSPSPDLNRCDATSTL